MTNIASVFKSEIARLARKALKGELESLKKASAQHRSHIAALRRQVESLQQAMKKATRSGPAVPARADTDEEGSPVRRFSPSRLAKHRQRLGLSAADFGALMGVSGQSIYKWEAGEARPRRAQLEAIAEVRTLGKREARARLDGLRGAAPAKQAVRNPSPARKPRGGTTGVPGRKRA